MSATQHFDACPDFSPASEKDAKRRQDDASARPLWGVTGGFEAPPAKGSRVYVRINQFGPATVIGYFVEHGYVGVKVQPDVRPEWHLLQNPGREFALVFGSEVRPITEADERAEPIVSPAAVACSQCGVEVSERCALAIGKWHRKRQDDAKLLARRIREQRAQRLKVEEPRAVCSTHGCGASAVDYCEAHGKHRTTCIVQNCDVREHRRGS